MYVGGSIGVTKPKKSPGGFLWGKSSTTATGGRTAAATDDTKLPPVIETPVYGPLVEDSVVHRGALARLVRITALYAARRVRLATYHHHGGGTALPSNPYTLRQSMIESKSGRIITLYICVN